MTSHIIEQFKLSIPDVKNQLAELKEKLQGVLAVINEGKLVPDTMTVSIAESLRQCRKKENELRALALELGISVEECYLDEMSELAEAAEQKKSLENLRQIVLDYFRLTSTAQDTLDALEESKKELQKVCRLIGDGFTNAFEPFSKVVEHTKSHDDLEETDYDMIVDKLGKIGKKIVRAVDKKQLDIDSDADISSWLDGSSDLLTAIEDRSTEQINENSEASNLSEKETLTDKLKNEDNNAIVSETIADDPPCKIIDTQHAGQDVTPLAIPNEPVEERLSGLPGHVETIHGKVTVAIEKDTPASEAHASKYISRAKKNMRAMVSALHLLVSTKVFPAHSLEGFFEKYQIFSKADVDYLVSHGYAGIITFTSNDKEQQYYVPSSKTCACLRRQEVMRFIKAHLPNKSYYPNGEDNSPIKSWSPVFAYHCKTLIDYCLNVDNGHMCVISRLNSSGDCVVCTRRDEDGNLTMYAPYLLRADEKDAVDSLASCIKTSSDIDETVIIVETMNCIKAFCDDLNADDQDIKDEIKFAVIDDPEHLYDASGAIVEDNEENDEIEAIDDETEDENTETVDETNESECPTIDIDDFIDLVSKHEGKNLDTSELKSIIQEAAELEKKRNAESESVAEKKENIIAESAPKKESADETKKENKPLNKTVMPEPHDDSKEKELSECDGHIFAAKKAFAMNRFDVGNVILKGVSQIENKYQLLAKQYSFATGDPDNEDDYKPSRLLEYFSEGSGTDPEYDLLCMSSWLRMYFSKSASIESYHLASGNHLRGNLAFEYAPSLSNVMQSLAEWTKKQGHGVEQHLLESALKHSDNVDKQGAAQRRATEMLESGELLRSSHFHNRIKKSREFLFGKESELYKLLQIIIEGDRSKVQTMKATMERFISLDNGSVTIDQDALEELMDDTWRKTVKFAKGKGQTEDLTGMERNTLRNKLTEVFTLLGNWLTAAGGYRTPSSSGNKDVVSLVEKIEPCLWSAVKDLEKKKRESTSIVGPLTVLESTIKELLERIRCEFNEEIHQKYFYAQLMKEPFVAVDEEYRPCIETAAAQMNPYDFCERAERYLCAEDHSWETVIKQIFNVDENRNGADYGVARALKEYLHEEHPEVLWPIEYDIDRFAERSLDKQNKRSDSVYLWDQNFTARLEMADGDGWFASTTDREKIDKVRTAFYEQYYLNENYGFYGRELNHILDEVHRKAQAQRPIYLQQLQKVKESLTEEEQSAPVFGKIEDLIKADRFGAAASYIQQAAQGVLEIKNEGLGDPDSEFYTFINKCNFLCQSAKLMTKMADTFNAQHKYMHNANLQSGEYLLKVWPESKTNPDTIANMLKHLGLDAKVSNKGKTENVFHAVFEDLGRIENYPHPIADFGSRMYKYGLDIILLFGNKTTDELFTAINTVLQKASNIPMLILSNNAILLPDRRKLARKIATNLRTTAPCLLLDRALVFYLADRAKSERWKILIQCVLPFQPAQIQNPYYENSSVEIPPEMFIGRRDDLQTIIASSGANLIYGGRQLGKTALLQRAKTLQHHPKENSWSSYVEVKGMDATEAAKNIGKKLSQCNFFSQEIKIKNWSDLTEAIERRMMTRNLLHQDRLLLLIDEADYLLTSSESNNYKELDLFKQLQVTTEGRFKFVMAGLHNVVRFSQQALNTNSGVPQLLGHTVKPLSFADARELLEIPLSYMGFMISPGDEYLIAQILYDTNYFPGLVHFYASRLVKYMQKNASPGTMPPYKLDREVLIRLLADEEFRQMRVQRLKMTLGIDANEHSYYDALAHLLCYCTLESEDVKMYGMTAGEIRQECKDFSESCSLAKLDEQSVEELLDELVILNIFKCDITDGQKRYMFSRPSFIEMLGSKSNVEAHLLEVLLR